MAGLAGNIMNAEFYILFKGDLVNSENKKGVISGFAELFSTSSSDIEKYFTGKAFFLHLCDDLSVAKQYHDTFLRIGARSYVVPPSVVNEIESDYEHILNRKFVLCPACNTAQTTGTHCVNCYSNSLKCFKDGPPEGRAGQSTPLSSITLQKGGVNKDDSRPCAEPKKRDEISEQDVRPENIQEQYAAKAKKIFQISSILMLAILTFDEMFANYLESHPDFFWQYRIDDIGILPYIVVTLLIVKACYYYVESKSMKRILCLLGFANIVGVGILLLMPDNKNIRNKQSYFSKIRISAVIMLAIIAYWGSVRYLEKHKISCFLENPLPFSDRFDYNNVSSLMIDNTVFINKLQQNNQLLDTYISAAYQILSENDLKMSQREKIADNIYRSVSNMTIWIDNYIYLYYLDPDHFVDKENLYINNQLVLSAGYIKTSVKRLAVLIECRNKELGDPIVNRVNRDWCQSYYRENDGYKNESFQKAFINHIFVPLSGG